MIWIEKLRTLFAKRSSREGKYNIQEDSIPVGKNGKPDLSFYDQPLQHYIELYEGSMNRNAPPSYRFKCRVHASWGLSVKGAEAIPFLLKLLSSGDSDCREDAAFLLGELAEDERTCKLLLSSFDLETDLVAKGSIVEALGKLRCKEAIPKLAALIGDFDADEEIAEEALLSFERIIRKRFDRKNNPREEALRWLKDSGQPE